jgi:acyl carrier protein
LQYVVTLNIETARDDEGVVFRYWSDNFTIDQITGIVNALANAFRAFIKDATETISHLNIDSSVEKTVVEKQQWKVDQTEAFTRDYIWQLLQDHPALESLIDERVRTIVRQMRNHAVRGDVRPNDEISASTSRKIPNVAEDDNSKMIQSESDDFSSTSDGSYEVIETPMASQIEGRGRKPTLEHKLRCLWSDKLNLPPSSIAKNDSFFDLGGDSIAAMGLVGDARDEGLILTVADIFRNPFFENMVSVVRIASEVSFVDEEINNMNRLGNQPISMATNAGTYERFALLKSANIDEAFLQKYICPRIGVFKGGIADILPVSDFQALSITGSLLDSRWMLNFFYLDGHGPVDFRRLKQSCFRVVQAFDILRTVFVASKGRFLQVILRKVQPEFSIYETEGRLDDFTALLQQRNREKGVRQGEPFVQFIVAKEKGTDHHRILIRLSHAQYDGLCLPRILAAIKAGYEGGPIPSTASFAHYIRESARTITSGHYTHWRTLLQGSRMTQIVHRRGPTYGKTVGTTQVLTKRTRVPSLANGNITTATIIKAAWALTLARITGSPDVVFGHTISGRSIGGLTGVESMVGPCVNLVPVRVQFRDNWTVHDLLRHVQDQQVANMPFEALGFRQIIKHCTDWSRWAYFSTVIQHDSVDSSSEMQLGENDYRVKVIGSNENLEDFMINSRQLERDHVDIAISFSCGRSVTVPLAQRVLDMVCDAAASFAANTNMTLPTPAALSALPTQAIDEPAQPPHENTFTSTRLTGLSRAETLILTDVIRRAWEQVLTDKDEALLPSPVKFDSSFFELGGDLIGLAQVVWLLEQEDFRVRLNDLIEHPTMMGQMAVLAQSNLVKTRKMTTTAQRDVVSPPSVVGGDDSPAVTTSQQQLPAKPRKSSSWASAFGLARKMVTRRVETGEN